jgi:hypothetical protein
MKVENSRLTGTAAGGAPPTGAVGREDGLRSGAPGRTAAGDRVELSGAAARIGGLLAAEAGGRAQRVASLARDVQAGRYLPDAAQTSRALIAETQGATADARALGGAK